MPEIEAERLAGAFARVLRGLGLDVPVGATLTFASALATVGLASRDDVYWAGRATLLTGPEQSDLYDRAFRVFWERARGRRLAEDADEVVLALDLPGDDDAGDEP